MLREKQKMKRERFFPRRCFDLLQTFEKKKAPRLGEKLRFSGVGRQDVYNISVPFRIGDTTFIAGRVEVREAWADSHTVFFREDKGVWTPAAGAPTFQLEDGFMTHVGDELIFGGVEIYSNPTVTNSRGVEFRTLFYRGRDLQSLQKFAIGPDMMKDIRIVPIVNGRIAVFTRPLTGINGRGEIGYTELDHLEDLNAQNILGAKIIENQFASEEWGGVNEAHALEDGSIGIVGHIAYQDAQGSKHYYAMSFRYDPDAHHASSIKIIATRRNFPVGAKKNLELEDVIFPGGLVRHGDGSATLYTGLSDVEAGRIILPDPFIIQKRG